jgi:hypothetical protein
MTGNSDSGDGGALPEPKLNSDVEARIRFFVQGYYDFMKDAADIYVRKCQLVLEAERDLPAEAVQQFFDRIRLPRNSGTYRKVRKIAEAGDRLLRVADKLPDSWTTLYQLAKMEPHVFDELVQDDVLHPDITAADLLAAKEQRSEKVAKEQFIVTIDGSELSRGEQIQMYREVKEAVDGYGATISDIPLAELEDEEEAQ